MSTPSLAASWIAACTFLASPLAEGEVAPSAAGDGTMSFGHDGEGRALLSFEIVGGDDVAGRLLFAAEGHHDGMFPDVVVEMGTIEQASFAAHSVKFSGQGLLHDDEVRVAVHAFDETPNDKADRFEIECTDDDGVVVFKAAGKLFRGDIRIGAE